MINWIHPGILVIAGALLIPFLKGKTKQIYIVALPVLAFIDCISMSKGTYGVVSFLGHDVTFGRVDKLSLIFSYVFTMVGIIGVVYALHVRDDVQHIASLIYFGSALGVTFAGDFLVLFIFWEFMAFSAVFLIWAQRSNKSIAAGFRYLLVHVFSGVCLLGGIVIHLVKTGSISFDSMMPYQGGIEFYLILISFIINAAVPPFGAWLPDAYPEATVTGAVFMTAFTTKSAVYVLLRGFPGAELLMWMGAIMAVYGVIYAFLENDGRRLLSYHIVSQVGFMVCGVGIGTEMALNGSASHAFAHIIYKALLFMGAGAVLEMTRKRKLTELGGIYKTMPITMLFFLVGGFSIAGAPLTSGFVSKSMTISAAGESHKLFAFLMLSLASTGTFLSIVLKHAYFMFFGKDSGIRAKEPPLNMLIAMGIASFICIFIGIFPRSLYSVLPFDVEYEPYTAQHVMSILGVFSFTALAFFTLLKKLSPKSMLNLDTDWFYRKGARAFMWLVNKPIASFEYKVVGEVYEFIIQKPILRFAHYLMVFDREAVDGAVNGVGKTTLYWSRIMQALQSGQVQHYAIVMAFGLFTILALTIFW